MTMSPKLKKVLIGAAAFTFFMSVFVTPRLMEAQLRAQLIDDEGAPLSLEAELNEVVQAACGTLTREARLVSDPESPSGWRAEPPDDLPAGYVACAVNAIGPGLLGSEAVELGPL